MGVTEQYTVHEMGDGGFINNCGLNSYLCNYLKEFAIYGFSRRQYCYLDIQTKPFSVRLIGCKYRKEKINYFRKTKTYDEQFDCDLTKEFEPLLENILNINEEDQIDEFEIIFDVTYYADYGADLKFETDCVSLVFEQFDQKIDISHYLSKLESYFEEDILSAIEEDLTEKYPIQYPHRLHYYSWP